METAMCLGFTSPPWEVEPFDGMSKFRLWQILVKDILRNERLIDTLRGKSYKPHDMTDMDWEMLELKAVGTIISYLTPNVQCTVSNEKSPEVLWKKLEADYALNFLRNRSFQKRKLYQLKMEEGLNIQDHINQFSKLMAQFEYLQIDEDEKVGALLTSLPSAYENLVTNILSGKNTVKFEDVITLLLGNSGLCSRKRCFDCHEKGHSQSSCERMKRDLTNPVDEEEEEDDENSLTNIWIFGTAAPFHVCSHRDWFNDYVSFEGYICAHNGEYIEIVGIGDVKVKMYDGNVMTLSGVRHVPSYVTNMISARKLSLAGYGCMLEGGDMTVTRGEVIVMEGEMMLNGLLKLKACAVKSKYSREVQVEATKYISEIS